MSLPIIIGIAAAALLLVVLLFVLRRRSSAGNAVLDAWTEAASELGIEVTEESKLGPSARGTINSNMVAIASMQKHGQIVTQYGVAFDAPEAPKFRLVGRTATDAEIVDTGNPKFDAVVEVQTEDADKLACFLTAPRRAAILRLLAHWPTAEILSTEAYIHSPGVEENSEQMVDAICHLVAAAETFDRPTERPASPAGGTAMTAGCGAEEGDVLTEVRLDEAAVIEDLFNDDLLAEDMAARFEQTYLGRQVAWTGEVMRIGSYDDRGRVQVVLLIGSADGQNPSSGRIFATAAVPSDPYLAVGKVKSFEGTLSLLDADQRLFHVTG